MTDASRADDEPLAFDLHTAGHKLGMKPKTIRRHIRQGSIKPLWLGTMLRIPASEVRRIAEQGLPRLPSLPNYKRLPPRPKAKAKAAKPVPPAKRLSARKAQRERRPSASA
jgi:hypothetical protein